MPTNLKSLLSRSRSRNELKKGEKEGDVSSDPGHSKGDKECKPHNMCEGCSFADPYGFRGCDQLRHCDTNGMRNSGSCSHIVSSYSGRESHIPPGTGFGNKISYAGSTNIPKSSVQEPMDYSPGVPMRKCETVVTLSSLAGNSSSCSSGNSNSSVEDCCNNGSSDKAKGMRGKILSTSSSTLNCLLHSSGRSKLISSWNWKFSSNNRNSGSDYPDFSITPCPKVRDGFNDTTDVQQMYKSQQLSIPDSGVGNVPMTPLNRLRRNVSITNTFYAVGANSTYSRSSSVASFGWRESEDFASSDILCRLCLCNVPKEETVEISACSCRYCKDCITAYVNFEIQEGADEIACPDASCDKQGALSFPELECLVSSAMMEKHEKFCLYREVEKDSQLMWCPNPGCETVCRIQESNSIVLVDRASHKSRGVSVDKSLSINCTTCRNAFCAECKLSYHPGTSCDSFRKRLIKEGKLSVDDEDLFSLESIKKCPFCHVPIEKDSGCAQILCRICKNVFCWYCLVSLNDDFLLRHYDKGPCKNKLGHSRASVVWHRAQVIGIFAGFGVLILLASPLLILAAPCLLCCRCRYCSKDSQDSPISL